MGRSARRVVGIVGTIAVPFAAPALATAFGASSIMGSAVAGGVLGGASSRLAGGRFGRGALLGGFAGGLSAGLQGMPLRAGADMGVNASGVPNAIAGADMGVNASGVPNAIAGGVTGGSPFVPSYVGGSAPAATTPAATGGVMQTIQNIGSRIFSGVQSPQAMAQLVTQFVGAQMAGRDPSSVMSREQAEALRTLQQQDIQAFNSLMAASQNLMAQAGAIDPEREGMMSAAQAQQRVARSGLETARQAGLSPFTSVGGMTARARRDEVMGQQAAETAYQRGFDSAQQRRNELYRQGAGLIPSGAATGALTASRGVLEDMQARHQRRRDAFGNLLETGSEAFGWWHRQDEEEPEEGRSP